MVARTVAAPPTSRSKNLAEPQIDASASVHSLSHLIGEVKVQAKVVIAPGTSIRADEGSPFSLGEATTIQEGVVMHGLAKGRVVGDDGQEYSVWIGQQTCIAHLALIHGPAYIGDNCFIGFRSTVFNARIGQGCIVMMHTLIQDVEIPPGKYVPSGAIITNQQQADRLPDVTESDRNFANQLMASNGASRLDNQEGEKVVEITPRQKSRQKSSYRPKNVPKNDPNEINYKNSVSSMSLSSEIVAQVRSLLSQGYTIGAEHADQRRFKTSSWLACGSISGNRAEQILAQLEGFLKDYQGQYVRLIGVDTKAKRRVLEMIIQRPGDTPGEPSRVTATSSNKVVSTSTSASNIGSGNLTGDLVSQVRSLLKQGYKIGTEYANQRRFKTSSWQTGAAIEVQREGDVIRALEAVLADHQGEYVRLLGIDTNAKRRVLETIIHRPGESPNLISNGSGTSSNGKKAPVNYASSGSLSSELLAQVRSLLSQGYKIGTEHADKRRFKTGSWHSCSPIESNRENEVITALEACLREHQGEYVRLLGIDTKAKRRVLETVIQRPDGKSVNGAKATAVSPPSGYSAVSPSNTASSLGKIGADIVAQVRSLINQGLKIGTEHADKRRFKTGSWQSCSPIDSNRESEVIAALDSCLAEHQGEYVRLLGIDTKAKRRVVEAIIQRP